MTEDYTGARILIVDDEPANVVLLERMLARAGYTNLDSTQDSREFGRLFREAPPDLVLLDLLMPFLDGYAILDKLRIELSPETYLPVLVLTADVTPQALQRALTAGARDFLTKPFDQTELLLRVRNLLETRYLYLSLQRQLAGLESLNDQAQQAILFRDTSLSTLSHDMGQPLAALRLTAEVLQEIVQEADMPEKEQLTEDLKRIDAASSEMAAMIGEMSDLARLQMGRDLVLQCRPVDLVELARQQIARTRRSAGSNRIRFHANTEAVTGEWDQSRLARVLSNLLNNAIKFSPKGGEITVAVSSDGDRAILSVSDQGLGIPAADLPHVFDRFFRATNVLSRIDGTGLGLASAKQIVEQHGGTIEVESQEGKGTIVRLSLPAELAGRANSV